MHRFIDDFIFCIGELWISEVTLHMSLQKASKLAIAILLERKRRKLTVDLIQNIKELLLNIPMQACHCSKLLPIGWQFIKKTNRGPHKDYQTVIPFKKAQRMNEKDMKSMVVKTYDR